MQYWQACCILEKHIKKTVTAEYCSSLSAPSSGPFDSCSQPPTKKAPLLNQQLSTCCCICAIYCMCQFGLAFAFFELLALAVSWLAGKQSSIVLWMCYSTVLYHQTSFAARILLKQSSLLTLLSPVTGAVLASLSCKNTFKKNSDSRVAPCLHHRPIPSTPAHNPPQKKHPF